MEPPHGRRHFLLVFTHHFREYSIWLPLYNLTISCNIRLYLTRHHTERCQHVSQSLGEKQSKGMGRQDLYIYTIDETSIYFHNPLQKNKKLHNETPMHQILSCAVHSAQSCHTLEKATGLRGDKAIQHG